MFYGEGVQPSSLDPNVVERGLPDVLWLTRVRKYLRRYLTLRRYLGTSVPPRDSRAAGIYLPEVGI